MYFATTRKFVKNDIVIHIMCKGKIVIFDNFNDMVMFKSINDSICFIYVFRMCCEYSEVILTYKNVCVCNLVPKGYFGLNDRVI